ncbi:hypothetical protein B0H10DRAFT_2198478 [Mycena sp. CBHHK59/15]|nr:hypothetical protein B0H10DRAFT_2198478 [Mycena sp. CBHHK59/15]
MNGRLDPNLGGRIQKIPCFHKHDYEIEQRQSRQRERLGQAETIWLGGKSDYAKTADEMSSLDKNCPILQKSSWQKNGQFGTTTCKSSDLHILAACLSETRWASGPQEEIQAKYKSGYQPSAVTCRSEGGETKVEKSMIKSIRVRSESSVDYGEIHRVEILVINMKCLYMAKEPCRSQKEGEGHMRPKCDAARKRGGCCVEPGTVSQDHPER